MVDMTHMHAPVLALQANDAIVAHIRAALPDMRITVETAPECPWQVPPDADVLVTRPFGGWRKAPAAAPEGWPFNLKWIQTQSAGVDAYPAWFSRGVTVTVGRGISAEPIAEYVMAAVLGFEKRLDQTRVRSAEAWHSATMGRLAGKTLGLVGYGAIGQAVARRAVAFGMRVMALRRSSTVMPDAIAAPVADLKTLFAESDHLVLAVPSTAETQHIINAASLSNARPSLHLINIARGALIDQDALADAVASGALAGATLDVTDPEPLPTGHRLYELDQVLITPHVSWYSDTADADFSRKFLDNMMRYRTSVSLVDVLDSTRGY